MKTTAAELEKEHKELVERMFELLFPDFLQTSLMAWFTYKDLAYDIERYNFKRMKFEMEQGEKKDGHLL